MFRVMTWNVENLFRPGTQYGPATQALYDAKLDGLAATINAQQPDALAVQEIGQPEALQDLVGRLNGQWHTTISSHPDVRGIRVAWLSRQAVTHTQEILHFPSPLHGVQVDDTSTTLAEMGRGGLAVQVAVGGGGGTSLRLVTAHLKSKLLEFPGGRFQPHDEDERARFGAYALFRRAAEAATLREWVTSALAGQGEARPLILTGDLNDTPEAATTQVLFGPPGSQIGTPGFGTPDKGDQQRLWDLAPKMPPGQDYSRIFEGRKELIDHVLVSAALVNKVQSVHAVIDAPVPSISVDPRARLSQPSSDHAPVVADFNI